MVAFLSLSMRTATFINVFGGLMIPIFGFGG
jgi:hypothetical protein